MNLRFWQSLCKLGSSSGPTITTGWITAFFPYLKDRQTDWASEKNDWIASDGKAWQEVINPAEKSNSACNGHGLTTELFPAGMARAPFRWYHHHHFHELEFFAGFVGVGQEADTLRLRPEIGWVVRLAL